MVDDPAAPDGFLAWLDVVVRAAAALPAPRHAAEVKLSGALRTGKVAAVYIDGGELVVISGDELNAKIIGGRLQLARPDAAAEPKPCLPARQLSPWRPGRWRAAAVAAGGRTGAQAARDADPAAARLRLSDDSGMAGCHQRLGQERTTAPGRPRGLESGRRTAPGAQRRTAGKIAKEAGRLGTTPAARSRQPGQPAASRRAGAGAADRRADLSARGRRQPLDRAATGAGARPGAAAGRSGKRLSADRQHRGAAPIHRAAPADDKDQARAFAEGWVRRRGLPEKKSQLVAEIHAELCQRSLQPPSERQVYRWLDEFRPDLQKLIPPNGEDESKQPF